MKAEVQSPLLLERLVVGIGRDAHLLADLRDRAWGVFA
jgi:hypothetical protein